MRRPIVLWFVVVFCVLAAFANLLTGVGAIGLVGQRSLAAVVGHIVISLVVVGASLWVALSLLKGAFHSRLPISLYLWFMLVIYPLCNVLRAFGLYLPAPYISDEQVAGAAAFELLRYLVILALIIWVAFSKALRSHLTVQAASVG